MIQSSRIESGLTWLEAVVGLVIIVVLLSLAGPVPSGHLKGQLVQTMNYGRQLQLAALQMANDGLAESDPARGWPGDLAEATTNPAPSVSAYLTRLMDHDYLKPTDMIKVTAAPGITRWNGVGIINGDTNCAFKIYRATSGDGLSNLFCATKNFTYNADLDVNKDPYKDKGFVVIRKGGDGSIYKPKQSRSLETIGLLPGRTEFTSRNTEEPGDLLRQE